MKVDDFLAYIEEQDQIEDEIREAYDAEIAKAKNNR